MSKRSRRSSRAHSKPADGGSGLSGANTFDFGNNRVTSPNFSFDTSGNLTANGSLSSFTYNQEDFMTAAGASVSYVYDAEGRRVRKTVGSTVTDYFYAGTELLAEKQGASWTDYIFFAGQRIAKQTGSTAASAVYLHTDHLGSTRVCTDANGNSTGTCDYEPYGEIQPGSSCSVPTNFRFAGMEWDTDAGPTGLYHTLFRQYDPNQGRWMSVDPLPGSPDDPQSLNRYVYVLNDPINLVDPSGLCSLQITYDVHTFWLCTSSGCTVVGGYVEITSEKLIGACGDRGGGGGGGSGLGRTLSDKGVKFISACEGFKSSPEKDPAGNCSIGYGHMLHRGPCNAADTAAFPNAISTSQALDLMRQDANSAANTINASVQVNLNQTQFDALVSFTYNVGSGNFGSSTLLSQLNAGQYGAVPGQMARWNRAGRQVLPGLVNRRRAEARLFSSGEYSTNCR